MYESCIAQPYNTDMTKKYLKIITFVQCDDRVCGICMFSLGTPASSSSPETCKGV